MTKKFVYMIIFMLMISSISVAGFNNYSEKTLKEKKIELKDFLKNENYNKIDVNLIISRPENALYVNNNKVIPLFLMTLIIGPIDVEAEITGDSIDKIEFYLDDDLKSTDYNEPYNWYCDETLFFKHKITVKAYNNSQIVDEDEKTIWMFNKKTAPEIKLEDVTKILMDEILIPAESDKRSSAFILTSPLVKNDIISSESENIYEIEDKTWFVFIDDDPQAFFAHETRYVLFDGESGTYDIFEESWPPLVNNISFFDTENLSKGDILEIYPVLSYPTPKEKLISFKSAPKADYGDAPEGQLAYWNITGQFPTFFNTTNSLFGRPGGHALNTGQETLGYTVSTENDANDPNDSDMIPNLVDSDKDERIYVISNGMMVTIAATVKISNNAPDVIRYINVLIDFDQNGKWTTGSEGKEWIVVNEEINIKPGKTETILLKSFKWGTSLTLVSPAWMRVALTRTKINETLFSNSGGWDGSGEFEFGEIEDQLVFLMDNPPLPDFAVYWPPFAKKPPGWQPPNGGGGGGQPGPGKGDECPCNLQSQYHMVRINCGDSKKHKKQKKPIVQSSIDLMESLCGGDDGFTDGGTVNPPKPGKDVDKDFIKNIKTKLDEVMKGVKCCDVLLIYICGHGSKKGEGIAIKDSTGETAGFLNQGKKDDTTDNTLNGLLNNCCPPCTEENGELGDCSQTETCCHVRLIIESCYAGRNCNNIESYGKTIIKSSNQTKAWANCRGGIFTSGFVDNMNDPNGDRDGDDDVDTNDAKEGGKEKVEDFNKKHRKNQKPTEQSQECDCNCPTQCNASVYLQKDVWDPINSRWVNDIEADLGSKVTFDIIIENDGVCRDIYDIELVDILPSCLDYLGNTMLYLNGVCVGERPPDSKTQVSEGLELKWDFFEIPYLEPGDNLQLVFDAETVYDGANVNWARVDAFCPCNPDAELIDSDTATVYVNDEEDNIPPITEKEIGQPNQEDGYIIWPYTPIWLYSTDEGGSGVQYIYYEIAWDSNGDGLYDEIFENMVYQDSAEIHMQDHGILFGTLELRWYAVDNAENTEPIHYQTHQIYEFEDI